MEKKTNVDFIAKENLDFISEAFKKRGFRIFAFNT